MKKRKAPGVSSPNPLAMIYGLAGVILAADQAAKYFVLQYLKPHSTIPIVPQVFHLTFVQNSGIAFGFFEQHPFWLTIVISVSVAALVVYGWAFRNHPIKEQMAYGFILGGALGNLVDRLRFQYVVDFLDFRVWPVFNVADSFITIGVILFIWFALKGR